MKILTALALSVALVPFAALAQADADWGSPPPGFFDDGDLPVEVGSLPAVPAPPPVPRKPFTIDVQNIYVGEDGVRVGEVEVSPGRARVGEDVEVNEDGSVRAGSVRLGSTTDERGGDDLEVPRGLGEWFRSFFSFANKNKGGEAKSRGKSESSKGESMATSSSESGSSEFSDSFIPKAASEKLVQVGDFLGSLFEGLGRFFGK